MSASDDAGAAAQALSQFEEALRNALAALPRDQVIKTVISALPVEVLLENRALHSGKVRKVSVSMPEDLVESVRGRVGAGGFSRYITEAVKEQDRLDKLDDLLAWLETEYGPADPDGVAEMARLWPDYEPE